MIPACTVPGDLVLDPFVGSGTTCRIAAELGRQCRRIELNPDYAAMAAKAAGTEVEFVSTRK